MTRQKRQNKLVLTFVVFGLTAIAGPVAAQDKPNIVVIMGDDIGWSNIGAYHRGIMSGKTPNIDKLAKQGMMFTDYYAEASCTAGRANFITGQLPIRTGLTTVGQAGSQLGISSCRMVCATSMPGPTSSSSQPASPRRCP